MNKQIVSQIITEELPRLGYLPETGEKTNQEMCVFHIWLSTYIFSLGMNIYPGDRILIHF